mmetsp:Transcript_18074/g.25478  ORF Transcript_18074/g.25478 Transcript_18074/m.25478 type:complete len:338 (-) Transcript_18074:119-1132(-)
MEIPTTMKAVVVHTPGDANTLTVETTYPVPTLEAGQVLIKNEFAGINFIDTYHRKGLYPRSYPFVAGQEGGGVVVKTTSDSSLKVGDRVTYLSFGSYAEYTAVPEDKVVPLPDDMKMDIAISCMTQGLTAHYLVTSAHANLISKGEWCLIYAIGSGTCQWAAQMAKLQGYKVIGTCSKGKKDAAIKFCDELIVLEEAAGASYADYTSVDIAAKVMDITGGVGVKCVIDGVGKSTVDISLDCLAPRGIFISFGNASGAVPAFPVLRLVKKSTFVTRPKLNEYMATREEFMMRVNEVFGYVKNGDLDITVDKVFELDNAVEGHKYLEGGNSRGKLLYKL